MEDKIIIAPMAGVSDYSYRKILREHGAKLCFSEMINVRGIINSNPNSLQYLKTDSDDTPLGIQLFGHEPLEFVEALKIIEAKIPFTNIDVNMGCPMKKIIKNGDGSALLNDKKTIYKIVNELRKNTDKELSVKLRLGYDENNIDIIEIAKIIEDAGADFITIHARTVKDMYYNITRWDYLKKVKEHLKIPLVGNGSIFTYEDALDKLENYGVDKIMLARAVVGNPFIVKEIILKSKGINYSFNKKEALDTVLRHLKYSVDEKGEKLAVLEFRKHLAQYLKTIGISKSIKNKLLRIKHINLLVEAIKNLIEGETTSDIMEGEIAKQTKGETFN